MVHELKVGDVMCKNLITVEPTALMSDLREVLRRNRISGLPVVENERLVGIVSIEDFIESLAARENGNEVFIRSKKYAVTVDFELLNRLKELLGDSSAYLRPLDTKNEKNNFR